MTRRGFLAAVPVAALAPKLLAQPAARPLELCIFSKHLQWAGVPEAARFAKEVGFDGIDLAVRPGGHVLPERVVPDLPAAVEAIRKAGLRVPMITTGIVDASSPHAETILRAASSLGIRYYRSDGFTYSYDRDIASQLEALKPRVHSLAELNVKYGMCAMYHTHSGPGKVGAPIWDLWTILRDQNPEVIGINYDIGHATVEGGYGGWIDSAHLVRKYMRGVALKDFLWARNAKGAWAPEWRPIGEGMVAFTAFFRILQAAKFAGPVQMHFEYKFPQDRAAEFMRRDLLRIRQFWAQAGSPA